MEGPLILQVKGTQKWKPCHCRINPTCFYYGDTKDSTKISSVPLNLIKNVLGKEGDSKYLIITLADGKTLSFLARSKGEAVRWAMLMQNPLTEFPSITISCPCARNLAAADANGFSDPFCNLNVLDSQGKLIVKLETHKIMKTLNPVWDYVFYVSEELDVLGVPESEWPSLTLLFEVYDWDAVGSNDFIGQCKFLLGKVPQGSNKQEWVTLEQRENHKDDVSGQIKLGLFWETQDYIQKKASFSFGRTIQALPTHSLANYSAPIPLVLIQMQEYLVSHGGLQVVGIFRLAPNERDADEVKAALNEGRFNGCEDVNCIAHLIKVWCRDLPERLMQTVDRKTLSLAAADEQAAGKLINSLFDPEASVLSWLLDLCVLVSREEEANKMSPKNLSIVFAPNLGARIDDPMEEHKQVKDLTEWMEKAITWRKAHFGEKIQGKTTVLQAEETPVVETLEELTLATLFRQIYACLDMQMLPDDLHEQLSNLAANEHSIMPKKATLPSANPTWIMKNAERPYYFNTGTGETAWPSAPVEEKESPVLLFRPRTVAPKTLTKSSSDATGSDPPRPSYAPDSRTPVPAPPVLAAKAVTSSNVSSFAVTAKPTLTSSASSANLGKFPAPSKKPSPPTTEVFDPSAVYADFGEFSGGGKKKSKKK